VSVRCQADSLAVGWKFFDCSGPNSPRLPASAGVIDCSSPRASCLVLVEKHVSVNAGVLAVASVVEGVFDLVILGCIGWSRRPTIL
jgi:hypothetical protein